MAAARWLKNTKSGGSMKLGMIGLGHMGHAIAARVVKAGYEVVGYDVNEHACERAKKTGITIADSPEMVKTSITWLMVPAGKLVDDAIAALQPKKGDIIIDGGNSKFTDTIIRAQQLAAKGILFLDCGVSGGLQGQELGFSLMVGGDKAAYESVLPLLQVMAVPQGCVHVGPSGAGHYVKMVHNGIEYGLLQAYGEGLQLLNEGSYKDLDIKQVVDVWRHGSIIRSFLLDLASHVVAADPTLKDTVGEIQEGGTGRWTADEAHKQGVPMPALQAALEVRKQSRDGTCNWTTRFIARMRQAFGGHAVQVK